MANITLLGASYTDVPAVDLPQTGGGMVRFYENDGGSATLVTKSITANGTYSASDDSADGYSEVTVNVPSSGGEVNIGTVTMVNNNATATSIQFTGLNGTPKAFFVRCTTALSRSTSSRNYYVVTIRYNGTDTVGNRFYRYNGQYNIVTSGYSYTYSGGTLTLTSSGNQTTAPGAFYSGGYELVYIY